MDQDREQDKLIATLDRRLATLESEVKGRNGSILNRLKRLEKIVEGQTCEAAKMIKAHTQEHEQMDAKKGVLHSWVVPMIVFITVEVGTTVLVLLL